ncbi:anthranilate synthase component I [Bacillus ginsengihumi]|uniref:Anthranilate synthase component 1 n=1 Tax=Heyndrickxia ginsengihumi TaxID=363870 RepID=A0A6M0P6P1_9BACI|nr:anthranilate synthase component I [Heyndrickxia ginsengihumi]NEY20177.1 anthranilate synthase component I [Heyndrickxia ginsengihumi]
MKTKGVPYKYKVLRVNGDMLTPIMIYTRLQGEKRFLLESSLKHDENGRYSFIGANPIMEFIGLGNKVTIEDHLLETSVDHLGDPLEIVKKALPNIELPIPFPFYGGAVGYIGYDVIRQYESIGKIYEDEMNIPDFHLMVYQHLVVFDHKTQYVYIVAIEKDEQQAERKTEILREQILAKIDEEPFIDEGAISFQPTIDKETFMKMVDTAKNHIENGDIFQVVLSQRMKGHLEQDPFYFYRKLRKANPSPYMFYLDFQDYIVLGASPESLIKTKGQTILTNPIAGTRPRGKSDAEDSQLEQELLQDEKELAEHKMLVDLSRNDLGRVCNPGTIEVKKYMKIEKYQHVMHIVSEVQGELEKGKTGIDALVSCLPAGTVSGAPKIRAMQIINELERKKRGMYAGAIGYISFSGDIDFALAIRSLLIKNNTAYLQSGAGIVYDSNPATEYEETLNKAKSILEAQVHDFITR